MTDFQLTPIGTSPAWYNPGEPASGFLLEAAGKRVLIDCGSGVIARYLELFGTDQPIDAVLLTHVHADHCLDLVPLTFGLTIGSLQHWPRPQLWLPPGAHDRFTRMLSAWDKDLSFFGDAFDLHHYTIDQGFTVGPFAVTALRVPHYIECFALRLEYDDCSFGYTADTGPCAELAPFMSGVDVLLAEAATASGAAILDDEHRGHITAREAGEIASVAGAHSLLLTHVPEENGLAQAVSDASSAFAGPVALARSGTSVAIAQRLAV